MKNLKEDKLLSNLSNAAKACSLFLVCFSVFATPGSDSDNLKDKQIEIKKEQERMQEYQRSLLNEKSGLDSGSIVISPMSGCEPFPCSGIQL
ncbi:hypothetical protein FM037_23510 [Shewanella psychropiezotolerans]|uniref:Uncharacterized protein n=1 Tax=Shewanella psychropiezotolerans TaxID=2593655 RepID=A0ABX5X2W3_9GAMM|nr:MULTISPECIES: hypothetical protein [Shewanella]MPY23635.1 hypothetical protein [Shewanella sp. YLB-07]QDO85689.1 hypothetical protein FM037_23510 [Shewanella psychropiezotolerans]